MKRFGAIEQSNSFNNSNGANIRMMHYRRSLKTSHQGFFAGFVGLVLIIATFIIFNEWQTISEHLFRKREIRSPNIFNSSITYKIPQVCYQTWITKDMSKISNLTKQVFSANKALNPYIDFQLWDDDDVELFMKKEFQGEVYNAFSTINPKFGAARADFFRYCVLFKRGGLYMDIKSLMRVSGIFGNIILPNDECVLDVRKELEPFRKEWKYGTYEQWFLAFMPGHPYLKRMIERMTRSIQEKIHINVEPGTDPNYKVKFEVMRITGPDALAVAIHDAVIDFGIHHREVDYKRWVKYSKVSGNPEYKTINAKHYNEVDEPFYLEKKLSNAS